MSAANFAGEPDVFSTEPTIVTHHIGDVTCILMVPAGCPVPHVALTVYPHGTTADERAVAVSALSLSSEPVMEHGGKFWLERESDDIRATVFLRPDDPDAQVPA